MKGIILTAIMSLALVSEVSAADKNDKMKKMVSKIVANFSTLDTNGDNKITEEEVKNNVPAKKAKALKQIFSKIDTDGDGNITKEELEKAAK